MRCTKLDGIDDARELLRAVVQVAAPMLERLVAHRRCTRQQFEAWATDTLLATLVAEVAPKPRRRSR